MPIPRSGEAEGAGEHAGRHYVGSHVLGDRPQEVVARRAGSVDVGAPVVVSVVAELGARLQRTRLVRSCCWRTRRTPHWPARHGRRRSRRCCRSRLRRYRLLSRTRWSPLRVAIRVSARSCWLPPWRRWTAWPPSRCPLHSLHTPGSRMSRRELRPVTVKVVAVTALLAVVQDEAPCRRHCTV